MTGTSVVNDQTRCEALADMPIEERQIQQLERAFAATAGHMRNQPELHAR